MALVQTVLGPTDTEEDCAIWMIDWWHKEHLERRIACPYAKYNCYPASEARYLSVEEFEKDTGETFPEP